MVIAPKMKAGSLSSDQIGQQCAGIRFESLCDLDELDHVEAPLAAFVFRDKGLRATETLSDLRLGKILRLAQIYEQVLQMLLSRRPERFRHEDRRVEKPVFPLILFSDYPRSGYIPRRTSRAARRGGCER